MSLAHGLEQLIFISLLSKVIDKFIVIFIKIPMAFFIEMDKAILKFVSSHKRPWIVKAILSKKNKAETSVILNCTMKLW